MLFARRFYRWIIGGVVCFVLGGMPSSLYAVVVYRARIEVASGDFVDGSGQLLTTTAETNPTRRFDCVLWPGDVVTWFHRNNDGSVHTCSAKRVDADGWSSFWLEYDGVAGGALSYPVGTYPTTTDPFPSSPPGNGVSFGGWLWGTPWLLPDDGGIGEGDSLPDENPEIGEAPEPQDFMGWSIPSHSPGKYFWANAMEFRTLSGLHGGGSGSGFWDGGVWGAGDGNGKLGTWNVNMEWWQGSIAHTLCGAFMIGMCTLRGIYACIEELRRF